MVHPLPSTSRVLLVLIIHSTRVQVQVITDIVEDTKSIAFPTDTQLPPHYPSASSSLPAELIKSMFGTTLQGLGRESSTMKLLLGE